MASYPQFLLIGDSIVQYASYVHPRHFAGFQFTAKLAEHCARKLDIVNRGLSGYNTSQAFAILDELIPVPSVAKVEYLLLLFGSNDACLPNTTGQHVPLEEYRDNLQRILKDAIAIQNPVIFLVTPPPVDENQLAKPYQQWKFGAGSRSQTVTAQYAQVVRDLAIEHQHQKVILIDLHAALLRESELMSVANFVEADIGLPFLLDDGLHLTCRGYEIFFNEILKYVRFDGGKKNKNKETGDDPNFVFPDWKKAPLKKY